MLFESYALSAVEPRPRSCENTSEMNGVGVRTFAVQGASFGFVGQVSKDTYKEEVNTCANRFVWPDESRRLEKCCRLP